MRKLSTKSKKEIKENPFYSQCALNGYEDHICGGRVTIEHAIIFAARQVDEPWALVPICAKFHGVDRFQDNGELIKEMTEWVALSRVTDSQLFEMAKFELTKMKPYQQRRKYLTGKYGIYIAPVLPEKLGINY